MVCWKRGRVEECPVAPLRNKKMKTLCGCRGKKGIWTRERLLLLGPESITRVNYKPILSSEMAPHIKKPATVKQKTKIWSWSSG
jgi:hypothetical protein